MIRSMTGFARREAQGPWGTLVAELRTVNHRYLEVSLRLPEELKSLESELRQSIAAALRRGKVEAALYLKAGSLVAPELHLNRDLLDQLLARVRDVSAHLGAAGHVSALEVLRWPGVIREAEADRTPILAAAGEVVASALVELNDMRAREGGRIRELLKQRCHAMQAQVQLVRARLPEVAARLRSRVLERIALLGVAPNQERLEQELVLYTHKMDVDEELDRLQSHLTEVLSSVDSSEPAGRRLDFLMQELNREANTLSSKSQDVETTRAAVELKVIIEQMREQVQNIE